MSTGNQQAGGSGRFTRREFLITAAAGVGVVALGGYAVKASGEEQPSEDDRDRFMYKGKEIRIEREGAVDGADAKSARSTHKPSQLYIDGERILTVHDAGEYRAANFMFSPQPTLEDLAKKMVDYQVALTRR